MPDKDKILVPPFTVVEVAMGSSPFYANRFEIRNCDGGIITWYSDAEGADQLTAELNEAFEKPPADVDALADDIQDWAVNSLNDWNDGELPDANETEKLYTILRAHLTAGSERQALESCCKLIKLYRDNCFQCNGIGEFASNHPEEEAQPCQTCLGAAQLLDEARQALETGEEESDG